MLLFGVATIGFVFTLYLTYLEVFVIHAICRWCIASAVIITAIWLVAVLASKREWGLGSGNSRPTE
jgi:uncharacterized membrane protein